MTLVLASASPSRRAMLDAAGLDFVLDPPAVDEDSIKQAMRADGAGPADVAEALAEMKAKQVSRRHPNAMVIGADAKPSFEAATGAEVAPEVQF